MKSGERYTLKKHKERLQRMMTHSIPCSLCPATPDFGSNLMPGTTWPGSKAKTICGICRSFVGLEKERRKGEHYCPCNVLGKEEAIKRTLIALEEEVG